MFGTNIGINKNIEVDSNRYKLKNEGKIKRDPTEDQLKSIEESQKKEKEWLSEKNHQLVPIDWDYVKETINLTDEERDLRHEQDLKEIHDHYDKEMAMIQKDYRNEVDKIDAQGEINQKALDGKNMAKAMAIIAEVRSGKLVSPFDMMFAQDIAPEDLAKAIEDAKKIKENTPYGELNFSSFINIKA